MIALPTNLDLTANQAAEKAQRARENASKQGEVLLGYLNQIRAAHQLGETSLTTTCLAHELYWVADELRQRGFEVDVELHLMHGQLAIRWPERPQS